MNAWVQLQETRRELPDAFELIVTVLDAGGIDTELFVYRLDTNEYSHLATLADLDLYPADALSASMEEKPFYRKSQVTRTFKDVAALDYFAAFVRARLTDVCDARNGSTPFAPGDTLYILGPS